MANGDTIPNNPELDEQIDAENTAISSPEHARNIAVALFDDNDERVGEAADIREHIDNVVPLYDPQELEEEGKGNKSNITTGFLETVINRVGPRLSSRVKNSRYLTASELDEAVPDRSAKQEFFRKTITKEIRNWKKFHIFINKIANYSTRYGYVFVCYTDPNQLFPSVYRLDDCAIPNGTEQFDEPDHFAIRETYTVKELFSKIENRNAAEKAGWDVDAVVEAINAARPVKQASGGGEHREDFLVYEDILRDVIKGSSYDKDFNVIEVFHVFAQEKDGTVSQYTVSQQDGADGYLYAKQSRYSSMDEIITSVTFEIGNGNVYGSYGVGKQLYDMAINIEKSRNTAIDNLRNRGKIWITCNQGETGQVKVQIVDDHGIIEGGQIIGNQLALPDTVGAAIDLDRWLQSKAEEKVGAFLPDPVIPGAEKTATQSQIDAQKEMETRNNIIDHFLVQWGCVVSMIQKRITSKNITSKQEKAFVNRVRGKLLEYLTEDELEELVQSAPLDKTIDLTDFENQRIVAYLQSIQGNPKYDQQKVEQQKSWRVIGEDLASEIIIPAMDQRVMTEAARLQIIELNSLSEGTAIPVSSDDNDIVHMQVLRGQQDPETGVFNGPLSASVQQAALLAQQGSIEQATRAMAVTANMMSHYEDHIQNAIQKGFGGEQLNTEKQYIAQIQNQLSSVQNDLQQSVEAQMNAQAGGAIPEQEI